MTSVLRSILFMLLMIALTVPSALAILLCFWLPPRARYRLITPWVRASAWLIHHLLGIRCIVLGRDRLPGRPAVVLCKHQSAWETIVLQTIVPDPVFVWKKELKHLPFFGWALARVPGICVDRGAGKEALRQLTAQGRQRLAEGYSVVVFPEGTRVPPGAQRRYKIGGAHLAVESGAPVVPVALNSGEVWGRNAFFKRPGAVTVSIGPLIESAGLGAEEVNARAEAWIETEMRNLSPHLYSDESPATPTGIAARA